jgi:hypothetical protein
MVYIDPSIVVPEPIPMASVMLVVHSDLSNYGVVQYLEEGSVPEL